MLFSAKAEYACIAMLELAARHNEPKPARLSDIADKHGIPPRFLVQILLDLKHAGLVASTRGAAGGYALARLPEEISMYDVLNVVDPTEQHARPDDPLQSTNYVNGIRSIWGRIVEMQKEILRETTLASLLEQSHGLQYVI
jgi:Rrf2 family protein